MKEQSKQKSKICPDCGQPVKEGDSVAMVPTKDNTDYVYWHHKCWMQFKPKKND